MKKYLIALVIGLWIAPQTTYSQEIEGISLEEYLKEAAEDTSFQEQTKDRITLLDINSDDKISYNEITNAAIGVKDIPDSITTPTQKEELNGYLLQAFEECDTNKDNELAEKEIDDFVEKIRVFSLKQIFENMDKNHDGVYNIDDMPSMEEAQRQMQESMENLQQTLEKLENTNPDDLAKQWMTNIGAAIADEDYFQMDKNQDGCVSREEYVTYELAIDEKSNDDNLRMTALDYARLYLDMKKAQADCITKEEYIAEMSRPIEEQLEEKSSPESEKEYAKLLFDEMDKDKNGKLTAEEYAEYNYQRDRQLSASDEPIITKENYQKMFLTVKAPDKGWMDKDEFVEDYIKEE